MTYESLLDKEIAKRFKLKAKCTALQAELDNLKASHEKLKESLEEILGEAFRETDRLTWACDMCERAGQAIAEADKI